MGNCNIALCGAYDILSYGDSLFPVALEYELKNRIKVDQVFLFAPVGNVCCMSNDAQVYSYEDLERVYEEHGFSAIIVGGGEMLHFFPITFSDSSGRAIKYEGAEVWKTPLDFAKKKGIPSIVNAVGAAYEFDEKQNQILKDSFENCVYVSVRDRYSFHRLEELGMDVHLVPDSLWNIDRYLNKARALVEGDYVALQYGTAYQNDELFDAIAEIKKQHDIKIVVLPINYCHEDKVFAEKARKRFGEEIIIFDRQLEVDEIYDIIANAKLFIGTSLHGTLTALSNQVPAIIVDMYPSFVGKMDGMVEWLQGDLPILSDVKSLYHFMREYLNSSEDVNVNCVSELKKKTDKHFDRIAEKIAEGCKNE